MLVHTRQPGSRCDTAEALDLPKCWPLLTDFAGLLLTIHNGAHCSLLELCLLTPKLSSVGGLLRRSWERQAWALKLPKPCVGS